MTNKTERSAFYLKNHGYVPNVTIQDVYRAVQKGASYDEEMRERIPDFIERMRTKIGVPDDWGNA